MKISNILLVCSLALSLTACKKEDPTTVECPAATYTYAEGKLVSCEGSFGSNNASVAWISPLGEVRNNVFAEVNGFGLGDVLQSVAVVDGEAYLVVNNSQKVEIVDVETFESVGTITSMTYPRHVMKVANNKIYLTEGATEGVVYSIDTESLTILEAIYVGNGPEQMTLSNDKVFVANSGGWAFDQTVSVLNPYLDVVEETILVGDRPSSIVTDGAGNVWVMCAGDVTYDADWNVVDETAATLQRINPITYEVDMTIAIGEIGDHPSQITYDAFADRVLIAFNGVTAADSDGNLISLSEELCSSIKVDPVSGDIFTTSVSDFVSNSSVNQLSTSGTELTEFEVGVGANGIIMN